MYAVSISDVVDNTEKGDYTVRFNLEDDLIKKCEETAASPVWAGTVSEGKFTGATGKVLLKGGILFLVNVSSKVEKIIIYRTVDYSSFIEFDAVTHQVLPPSYTAEEIKNLIKNIDPELCEKFDKYLPLDSEKNKAGISFQTVSIRTVENALGFISYANEKVKNNQNFANECTARFLAVDAEHPEKKLNVDLHGGHNADNTEFFGTIWFKGDIEAQYVFLGFKGLSKNESAELETDPLFFAVELGDKYVDGNDTYRAIKSYCEIPYSAGDMFNIAVKDE
jgi:hypothetical protein